MTIDSTSETRTESRKGVTAMNNGRTVEALSVGRGARRRASMSTRALLAAACLAVVVPACGPNPDEQIAMTAPVEYHRGPADRLYVANETAGSITVIDTTTNSVIATVGLGSDPAIPGTPQPNGPNNAPTAHHSPFYDGHADPHGLWLTDDDRFLLVAARLSGTLVAIDTTTLRVVGYLPVGREPHLATVRPGADEAWVAVRGENYVEIVEVEATRLLDGRRLATDRLESTAKLPTANGPSMVSFTSDGSAAFVAMGKEARVQRFDAPSRTLTHEVPASAPFTPFGLVFPDDTQLWLVHKGAGSVSVLRTADLGTIVAGMAVGPRANHVAFVANLAYVTVGGPAPSAENPDPEGKVVVIDRSTRAVVAELTGPPWRGERTASGRPATSSTSAMSAGTASPSSTSATQPWRPTTRSARRWTVSGSRSTWWRPQTRNPQRPSHMVSCAGGRHGLEHLRKQSRAPLRERRAPSDQLMKTALAQQWCHD